MEKPKQKQLLEPVVGCVRVMWLGKRVRKEVRGAFVCRLSVMRPALTTSTALNFCQRGRGPLWVKEENPTTNLYKKNCDIHQS